MESNNTNKNKITVKLGLILHVLNIHPYTYIYVFLADVSHQIYIGLYHYIIMIFYYIRYRSYGQCIIATLLKSLFRNVIFQECHFSGFPRSKISIAIENFYCD